MKKRLIALFFLTTLFCGPSFAFSALKAQSVPEQGIPFNSRRYFDATIPQGAVLPSGFTVAAWIKTDAPEESQGILGIGEPARFFTFYLYRGAVRMLVEENHEENRYSYALAPAPAPGVWTHYAGSYDGKTIRVYVNGKLADEKPMKTRLGADAFDKQTLLVGAAAPYGERAFRGALDAIALWNRTLDEQEIAELAQNSAGNAIPDGKVALWNADGLDASGETILAATNLVDAADSLKASLRSTAPNPLLNRKDSGYRGIWYYNQKLDNEYVYKYSGGLGTYPANHYPFAIYRPEVDKTFFCYGGFDPDEKTLWHEVGVYDHKTHKVSRPTVILDKKTEDAHDNPVLSIDDEGYVWIFSTSHGTSRPSFIHRSVRPYDVDEFELVEATKLVDGAEVPMTNFSYWQVRSVPKRGFVALFTTYDRSLVAPTDPNTIAQRIIALTTSDDGVRWSAWKPITAMEMGHYQNACVLYDENNLDEDGRPALRLGTAFNYHPAVPKGERGVGLNWRTNLYYIESTDAGASWHTIDGTEIDTPMLSSESPALVRNYESENLNVYVTDLNYDAQGRPVIAYVTSKGFESGPEMGPRYFCVARWNGEEWLFSQIAQVDNNYEYAMIYPEEADSGTLRLVGSFEDGPQAYNTGGEISQWVSRDNGASWKKEFQLTENSAVNQCFPRRTIDASPEFYAFWAEGDGRKKSISTLLFSTKDGKVYALPREMKEDWEEPVLLWQAPKL